MPTLSNKSPYRLLVEGPDDQHAVTHLMKRHGFDWDDVSRTRPFIESAGGISGLLDSTNRSLDVKSYLRLGLVLDADLNVTDQWAKIRGCFSRLGIALPDGPGAEGTVVDLPQQLGFKLSHRLFTA